MLAGSVRLTGVMVIGKPIVVIALMMAISTAARGQVIDKPTLDRVKDSTVFIKTKIGEGGYTGSGFVIKVTGDKVLIMTNRHVAVHDPDEMPAGAKPVMTVVFRSGTPLEQELPAKVLAYDEREIRDLAVLEVTGVKTPPEPFAAEQSTIESDFFETMQAYAVGFPLGSNLQGVMNNRRENPAITVTPTTISKLSRDDAGHLSIIQYSGAFIGGNSGGPVVDSKGRLISVVVARVGNESIGFAIAPTVVKAFLGGDIDGTYAEKVGNATDSADVKLVARLVDPLNKLRSVAFRYASDPGGTPQNYLTDKRGNFDLLANATTVPMVMNAGMAGAQFTMKIAKPEERKLLGQFVVTDILGRAIVTRPMPITIPERAGRIPGLGEAPAREKTMAKWSCEGNLWDGVKIKNGTGITTIDVPGGMALVNAPQYKLFNAPYAMVRVDGDFAATVKVTNDFDPGGVPPVIPGGRKFPFTFQGAGLLLWQDEKNFVRFERTKGSTGEITLSHRILVEIYKNGKEVGLNYDDIPEKPVALVAMRKGASLKLLFALPGEQLHTFQEISIDFEKEIYVGVAAANLSKRPFQAKLEEFRLLDSNGKPYDVKPAPMAKLIDTGGVKLADGTWVYEGASLRVIKATGGSAEAQKNMEKYSTGWSDNRQLWWQAAKSGDTLSLEVPVETDGKYEIKATFTQATNYGKVNFAMDLKPLPLVKVADLYSKDYKPMTPMSLGTVNLTKGKHKFTITVTGKNPGSAGYFVGLDDLSLIPAK